MGNICSNKKFKLLLFTFIFISTCPIFDDNDAYHLRHLSLCTSITCPNHLCELSFTHSTTPTSAHSFTFTLHPYTPSLFLTSHLIKPTSNWFLMCTSLLVETHSMHVSLRHSSRLAGLYFSIIHYQESCHIDWG